METYDVRLRGYIVVRLHKCHACGARYRGEEKIVRELTPIGSSDSDAKGNQNLTR